MPPRFDRGGPGPPSPPPQPLDPLIGPNSRLNPSYPYNCPQYVQPGDYLGFGPKIEIEEKLPPKPENHWAAMGLPYIDPSEPEKPRDVIPDGGNFICGPDDMCPTTIKVGRNFYKSDHCNPTTASDVPGPAQDLCYNSRKLATFYPRQRRVMTNSGDKFPTGYKFDPELQIEAQECLDRNQPPATEPATGPTFGPPVLLSLTSSPETISVTNTTSIYQQPTKSPNSSVFKVGDTVVYAYDDSILVVGTTDTFILLDGDILTEYQITISAPPPTFGPPVFLSVTSSPQTISVTNTSSIYQQTTKSPDSNVVKVGDTIVYGYDESKLAPGTGDMFILLDDNVLTEYQITISFPPPTTGETVFLSVSSSPETIIVSSTTIIYQETTRSPDSNVQKVGNTIVYTYDDSVLVEGTTDTFVLLDNNILTEFQITISAPTSGPHVFLPVSSSPETVSVTSTTSIYQQTTRYPDSSVEKVGDTIVYTYDPALLPIETTDMFILLDNGTLTEYQITIIPIPPTYGPAVFLTVNSSPETISVTSTTSIYQQTNRSPDSSVEKVGDTILYTYDSSVLLEGSTDLFVLLDDNILTEYQITIGGSEIVISETVNLNVEESPWIQDMVPTVDIYQQPITPSSSLTRTFFPAIDASAAYVEIEYTYDPAILTIGSTDMFILSNDGDLSQYNVTIVEPTPTPETLSEPETELEPYDILNEYTANFYSSDEFQWSLGSTYPFSIVQAPVHGTIILVDSDGDVLSDNPATAPATTSVGLYYLKYIPNDPDNPNYSGGDYVIFRQVNPENGDISESRITINLVNE